MIIGIGCDIIEVERIRAAVNKGGFLERVYTEKERRYCTNDRGEPKYQSYAARFAAKEALVKALGVGFRAGTGCREIEVLDDELGKPILTLCGGLKQKAEALGVTNIFVTLSHIRTLALAQVVLEKVD